MRYLPEGFGRTDLPRRAVSVAFAGYLLAGCIVKSFVLVGFVLVGCGPVKHSSEEVHARWLPEADRLELLLVQADLRASLDSDEKGFEEAVAWTRNLLAKRRSFRLGPMCLDLDDLEGASARVWDRPSEWDVALSQNTAQRLRELLRQVTVRDAGLSLSPEGWLSSYQVIEVPNGSEFVEIFNRAIAVRLAKALASGELRAPGSPLDERTLHLWDERVASGQPWLRIDGPDFVADLPLSRDSFQKLRARWLGLAFAAEADDAEYEGHAKLRKMLISLIGNLSEAAWRDERFVARFAPDDKGRFRLWLPGDRVGEDRRDAFLGALRAAGIEPACGVTLEALRKKL